MVAPEEITVDGNSAVALSNQWQQLPTWAIAHFYFHALFGGATSLFPAAVIGVVSADIELNAFRVLLMLGGMFLLSLLLLLPLAWLKHRRFRYFITTDSVKVRQGVLFRKQLNLEFERIQNVNIRHPFYFRPLGLVTLKIDGAGSSGEEVYLAAITFDLAQQIRAEIKHCKAQPASAGETHFSDLAKQGMTSTKDDQSEQAFYSRSNADLVIHGLTNNRAWLIVAGLLGFTSTLPISYGDIIRWLSDVINILFGNQNLAALTALFIVSLILSIGLLALLSVIISIVTYYGYTLFRSEQSLMVHCGLLSKHEINMQKSRVQTLYIAQDWLGLLLKRNNVVFEQISLNPYHQSAAVSGNKLIVPAVPCEERSRLLEEILPGVGDPENLQFLGADKRLFFRNTALCLMAYLIFIVAVTTIFTWSNYFLAVIPVISLHCLLIYMSWLRKGIAQVNHTTIIRKGLFGIEYILFPDFKIQAAAHRQTLLMKRRQLSTVTFMIASRTVEMPFVSTAYVGEVLDRVVYRAEVAQQSTM